jgi:hypothetical protein
MTKNGVAGCKMEAAKVVKRDEQSEAEYVDSQYEYLMENKDKGITFEELRRRRSAER